MNVRCKEKTFGEWLRTRRFERRLKSQEAAERAGMRLQSWSNYEHDWRRNKADRPTQPRLETLRAIATGLDMSVEEVIAAARYYFTSDYAQTDAVPPAPTGSLNHRNGTLSEREPLPSDVAEVLEYYSGLSSLMKPAAKELLRTLFEEDRRLLQIRQEAATIATD